VGQNHGHGRGQIQAVPRWDVDEAVAVQGRLRTRVFRSV
jgi:hypothetical protein